MSERLQHIAVGIVRRNNKVLLIERRQKENGHNNELLSWVFPGGKIEVGESSFIAVEREVYEETGYEVEALETLENDNINRSRHIHYIACRLSKRNPDPVYDSGVNQANGFQLLSLVHILLVCLTKKRAHTYLDNLVLTSHITLYTDRAI